MNITDLVRLVVERFDAAQKDGQQYEVIKYAIRAEAKFNKDLAGIICRNGKNTAVDSCPALLGEFSTYTESILLTLGVPAKYIFNEQKFPDETELKRMETASVKMLEKKSAADLYEFYIRKCNMLKCIYRAGAMDLSSLSVYKRCKNIEHATRILVERLT